MGRRSDNQAKGPFTFRSIAFSSVNPRMGDACGKPIYSVEPMNETFATLAWAAEEGLVDGFSAWDDDFMPWSAEEGGPVLDRQDEQLISDVEPLIGDSGLVLTSFGCNLVNDPLFRNGAFTNPDERIRRLAMRKVERAAAICRRLSAKSFRLHIGREGYEEPNSVNWKEAFRMFGERLDMACQRVLEKGGVKNVELMAGCGMGLRRHLFMR